MDLTTLVSGHLRYLGLGSPLIGNLNFNRTTGAGLALGQGTAASPTIRIWGKAEDCNEHLPGTASSAPGARVACSAKQSGQLGEGDVGEDSGDASARARRQHFAPERWSGDAESLECHLFGQAGRARVGLSGRIQTIWTLWRQRLQRRRTGSSGTWRGWRSSSSSSGRPMWMHCSVRFRGMYATTRTSQRRLQWQSGR
jgi:hypothetical protein